MTQYFRWHDLMYQATWLRFHVTWLHARWLLGNLTFMQLDQLPVHTLDFQLRGLAIGRGWVIVFTFTLSLSTQKDKWIPVSCQEAWQNTGGGRETCSVVGYLPIQGGEVILLLTSSYGKQNKLPTDEQFGSITNFTWHHLSSTLIEVQIISWYNVYKLNVVP